MKYFRSKAVNNCYSMNKINEKRQIIMLLPKQITEFVLVAMTIIFVLYAFNSSSITEIIPSLTIFGFAALRLLPIMNSISIGILNFRHDNDILNRLYNDYQFIKKNSEDLDEIKTIQRFDFSHLEVKNIQFSYTKNKKLLSNISFKIDKGDMVGITGGSGSGKSTLIDIIIGLIKPDSGEIIINKKPSTKELFKNFQTQVSYIPQDSFLIDASIMENIAIGIEKEKVETNKIKRAVKASSLEDFINKLPDNIETKIGQNGLKISGGQKQRISLARSLYHERKFIVMDEGTSALDNKTEKIIMTLLIN